MEVTGKVGRVPILSQALLQDETAFVCTVILVDLHGRQKISCKKGSGDMEGI